MIKNLLNSFAHLFKNKDELQEEKNASLDRYQWMMEASNDGVFEWNFKDRRIHCSARAFEILGINQTSGWVNQQDIIDVFTKAEQERIVQQNLTETDNIRKVETFYIDEMKNKAYLLLKGKVEVDEQGKPSRVVGSISNITEQKHLEQRLRHDALHDYLTGLANRTLLIDRIQHILSRVKRNSELNAALLFIDIDNFKAVNDNLGHSFGDDVLVSVGERLTDSVRAADTVARLSGDEFVILLEDLASQAEAGLFAERLLIKLEQPLRVQNRTINITTSIGLALISDPGVSVESVLGDADIAMAEAKSSGKDRVVSFEAAMRTTAAKRLDIESALRQAIKENELSLAYQPIFDLQKSDPRPVGCEALLRWSKSTEGNIAPAELLTLAEENGLIEDIGFWVIQTAATQLQSWYEHGYPEHFYININLSSRHFDNEGIVHYLLNEIDNRGLPRNGLRVEIVENAVIRHPDKALVVIERLKREGIHVSIDDFGTGFSSLSYLHRFPFHALKIDRSFVEGVTENKATQDIVMAIIVMARKLGIKVVAEGIENSDQLDFLKDAGCELGQGYLLARPEQSALLDRFFIEKMSA